MKNDDPFPDPATCYDNFTAEDFAAQEAQAEAEDRAAGKDDLYGQPFAVRCVRCKVNFQSLINAPLFDGLCRECWCKEHHPQTEPPTDDEVPF